MTNVNVERQMVLSPNDEVASSKQNIPNSRLECTNHTLFQTKMVKIDTLFQTKTAKKIIPFGAAHTYISYVREYPQGVLHMYSCTYASYWQVKLS